MTPVWAASQTIRCMLAEGGEAVKFRDDFVNRLTLKVILMLIAADALFFAAMDLWPSRWEPVGRPSLRATRTAWSATNEFRHR
ncbi:MAG: hypothetical protein WB611_25650 [Stellaceae bacterium]